MKHTISPLDLQDNVPFRMFHVFSSIFSLLSIQSDTKLIALERHEEGSSKVIKPVKSRKIIVPIVLVYMYILPVCAYVYIYMSNIGGIRIIFFIWAWDDFPVYEESWWDLKVTVCARIHLHTLNYYLFCTYIGGFSCRARAPLSPGVLLFLDISDIIYFYETDLKWILYRRAALTHRKA